MGKSVPDAVMDVYLGEIADTTNLSVVADASTPTEYSTMATLASVAVTTADFTIANGDVSGRKVTVAQQAGISITATSTARHVVLTYTATSTIRLVTTCTEQLLTSGGTVTVPAYKLELTDVT